MVKISNEEYKILKNLDAKWKWLARDKNRCLYVFTGKPVKKYGPLLYWGTEGFLSFELFDEKDLFQFIQWEDGEPYNIAELIEEYEIENSMRYDIGKTKVVDIDTNKLAISNDYFYVKESEETEMKNIEWFKEEFYKAVDRAMKEPMNGGGELKYIHIDYIKKIINQLDETEAKNITLQDVSHEPWEMPFNRRKYWLEQLNDESQEGYVVPLGLKTTDGKEQYLTFNGSYFASRRNKSLQQTFATLEEIPEFYRYLAERIL